MIRNISIIALMCWLANPAVASDRLNILKYAGAGKSVDRTGAGDASQALSTAITAANEKMSRGEPACIYIPPGTYRIVTAPPPFVGPGCIVGDGTSQSTLSIDPRFRGDLFAWSEAWFPTAPGPIVIGITIRGSRKTAELQNALVFYDRNDEVFIDNVDIRNLHGRALYSGVTKKTSQAYMRESHMRSMRFFEDGAPGVPVVEFNSQGAGETDATNEVRLSQLDIFGSHGPSFIIRNNGSGAIRDMTIDALRIEGLQVGNVPADLLTIGDPVMKGNVNNIVFRSLELINPYEGYAALRLTAPPGVAAPYQITVDGMIGGGAPRGQGLRIDAGRMSTFRFSGIHTFDTNVVIGRAVSDIVLDGGGQEAQWTYKVDSVARRTILSPVFRAAIPIEGGVGN
jgi:hypothetical protein